MSEKFIEMISEIYTHNFKSHFMAAKIEKVPMAFFFGFTPPPPGGIASVANFLIQNGFNLQCAVCLFEEQKKDEVFANCPVPVVSFGELAMLKNRPKEILLFNFKDNCFTPFFNILGIDSYSFNEMKGYLDFVMNNLSKLYQTYSWLGDEESKETFLSIIKGNALGRINTYRFAKEPQYFLDGFLPGKGDIAIDGGAFDGATARDFSKLGAKVYAFEMNEQNYKNCLRRAEEFGFTIENYGLSNRRSTERYAVVGAGSFKLAAKDKAQADAYAKDGGVEGHFIDLDTYVKEKNIPHVDYIKLDIEGSELDMLNGAVETIKKFKPKMAISSYHKQEDFCTLPQFIKSVRPDYEFELRHYKIDCTDYFLNDIERKILNLFGLEFSDPTGAEHCLYCK